MRADLTDPHDIIEYIVRKTVPMFTQQEIVLSYLRQQDAEIEKLKSMLGEIILTLDKPGQAHLKAIYESYFGPAPK